MGNPDAVTLEVIAMVAPDELRDWLRDRTSRRQIPHRLETAGYVKVRNPGDKGDGRWTVDGKRQAVYAKKALSPVERLRAAQKPHKAPF
jgi:hypothetical protein